MKRIQRKYNRIVVTCPNRERDEKFLFEFLVSGKEGHFKVFVILSLFFNFIVLQNGGINLGRRVTFRSERFMPNVWSFARV